MNFVNGMIISDKECDSVLERIGDMILDTLRKPPLDVNLVISACDAIVNNAVYLDAIRKLLERGSYRHGADMYMEQIAQMLSAEAIRERMRIELGEDYDKPRVLTYAHSNATAVQTFAPIGVLFHITAGNVDGLPFVSLLDGLLTGNINIVKLPKDEGGITVALLAELMKLEPSLKEYVYVFDYSSREADAMKKLANVADAIVIWGGDEAIAAIRKMADPNTRIIEWGHKISFAYVTKDGINMDALEKLAYHICMTNQLFCSSCQGIFFDTDNMQDVYGFCAAFLPILEKACREYSSALDATTELFVQAEVTLQNYHRQIENKNSEIRVFREQNCSITAQPDSRLETSIMHRNIWVKPLKRNDIINLRVYKNYLQTASLICGAQEHAQLANRLLHSGIVKISDGFEMSNHAFGEAHDGTFALRCYTKLVSVQNYSPGARASSPHMTAIDAG